MPHFASLSLIAVLLVTTAAAQDVVIDWSVSSDQGLQKYPARIDPPAVLDIQVKNVNDYLYSYRGSVKVDPVAGTSISATDLGNMLGFLSAEKTVDACKPFIDAQARLATGIDKDFTLKKKDGVYPSVPLAASRQAWQGLRADYTLMEAADGTGKACPAWKDYDKSLRAKLQTLAHADGSTHEFRFQRTLSDNGQVTVSIEEDYANESTDGGKRDYMFAAQSKSFFLSVGYLITEAQARSYDAVDIGVIKGTPAIPASNGQPAVAATADQTIRQLRIQGDGRFRPAGAVLLNYKLPVNKLLGPKWGIALSAGPVYRVAQSSGASTATNWGVFAGASVHLWERFWITPGFHVAEFSDLPLGFTAAGGLKIPDGYPSSFTGVNRWTTRFGIGITFKTSDFKTAASVVATTSGNKSSDKGAGLAGNTPAAGAGNTPATGAGSPAPATNAAATGGSSNSSIMTGIADTTKALADATTDRDAATSARTAADGAVKTRQKALDDAKTARAATAAAVDQARRKLSDAPAADRDAAAKALDDAEKRLEDSSEKVGTAQGDLTTATDTAKAATSALAVAVARVAGLTQKLADLQDARKKACDALGGCAQ